MVLEGSNAGGGYRADGEVSSVQSLELLSVQLVHGRAGDLGGEEGYRGVSLEPGRGQWVVCLVSLMATALHASPGSVARLRLLETRQRARVHVIGCLGAALLWPWGSSK
nr:hypothetical protein CFP56_22414 [Quercus suber]